MTDGAPNVRPKRDAKAARASFMVRRKSSWRGGVSSFAFLQSTRATGAEHVRVGITGMTKPGRLIGILCRRLHSYHGLLPRIPWRWNSALGGIEPDYETQTVRRSIGSRRSWWSALMIALRPSQVARAPRVPRRRL